MRYIISILILTVLVGCGGRNSKPSVETSSTPENISPAELLQQRVDHYWDDFDFEDDKQLTMLSREQMIYALSEYVTIIPEERADSLMRALIRRASTSHDMLDYFYTLCEIVLHNPNSALRNDEYYIPEYERIAPAYDLEIALKNRIGRVATDFVYTLEDDTQGTLHDIKANYTILMFSNPECPLCGEIMRQIASSQLLTALIEHGVLKVLTLYPDEDIAHWRKYIDNIPSEWIRAYDKGGVLTKERLYNLSAIPALYLLDRDKRVLIKDGTSVADIESLLMCI